MKFGIDILNSTVGEAGKYLKSILFECKCSTVV